jgi:hypothetical protein
MGTLLRKVVAPIHGGSLHNNDRLILFNIAQVRKMKEQAVGRGSYVLVDNRCEGNAPLTMQALSEMLQSPSSALATDERG